MPLRLAANVRRIIDGDTLIADVSFADDVLNLRGSVLRRVRVVGMNAPELHAGPQGPAAKAALEALLAGGGVEVEVVRAADDFGRLLARVFAGGVDVTAAMIDGGHAVKFRGLAMRGK